MPPRLPRRLLPPPLLLHSSPHRPPLRYSSTTLPITAKWLTNQRTRIGKCLTFGLPSQHLDTAGEVLKCLATEWRELVAGSEGFLTGEGQRGLFRREVVWGEMVGYSILEEKRGKGGWKEGWSLEMLADKCAMCVLAVVGFNGHVNNVTYNRYAESARINWALNHATHHDRAHAHQWRQLWTPKGDGLILRSITTDFKFPMTYPDKVSVYHRLSSPPSPTSPSIHLSVLILSEGHRRPAARCSEDIVLYDYRTSSKMSLESRPWLLEALEREWGEQERARRVWNERARWVEGVVDGLEVASWRGEGAVEDMGGA